MTPARGTERRLRRDRDGRPAPPVRLVHLGLGSFFRAHAAWYTEHAADAADWGWWAFTGRRGVEDLLAQDSLYTLLVRGPDGDRSEVVSALSRVGVSTDLDSWREAFALPDLAVVTLSVTEAAYCRDDGGRLDPGGTDVAADVAALREGGARAVVTTVPGKLLLGLAHRHDLGLGGVTLVPCDNLPGNGAMLRGVLGDLLARVGPKGGTGDLAGWIRDQVGFVSTMVDRITPRPVAADREGLRASTGLDDPECVVTEPFSEWVLGGEFVAGRPDWASAGARFVDDVAPAEQRKLWLLNGAHSLMAYAAGVRGATTVSEAIADPVVRGWVEHWWDDAAALLPLPAQEVADYRTALVERWANPRINHRLAQIAADGSQKVPVRALPVLRAALDDGWIAGGATRLLAAWTVHLRRPGEPVADSGADDLAASIRSMDPAGAVDSVLARLGVHDNRVADRVLQQTLELDATHG